MPEPRPLRPTRVLIVGLGHVGLIDDLHPTGSGKPTLMSHASAVRADPAYTLVGGVDPVEANRSLFTAMHSRPAWTSLGEIEPGTRIDLVVVACPTSQHSETIEEVVSGLKPSTILCEKPFGVQREAGVQLVQRAEASGIGIYVNYMRRCLPEYVELRRLMSIGELGSFRGGVVTYGQGLYRNGCHFVNLMEYLLGRSIDVQPIESLTRREDSPSFVVQFADGEGVTFVGLGSGSARLAEVVLSFERAVVRLGRGGRDIEVSELDVTGWPVDQPSRYTSNLNIFQQFVYQTAEGTGRVSSLLDVESALSTLGIMEAVTGDEQR